MTQPQYFTGERLRSGLNGRTIERLLSGSRHRKWWVHAVNKGMSCYHKDNSNMILISVILEAK